jgi:monofunctional chorismate mutase
VIWYNTFFKIICKGRNIMDDLILLREKINEIDQKLVVLFEERMEIVLKVAQYKRLNSISILDEDREKEVIDRNKARLKNKNFEDSLEKFLNELMNLSKKEQKKINE